MTENGTSIIADLNAHEKVQEVPQIGIKVRFENALLVCVDLKVFIL